MGMGWQEPHRFHRKPTATEAEFAGLPWDGKVIVAGVPQGWRQMLWDFLQGWKNREGF